MEEMSELHKWVKRQEEAGVVESSGSFSIEQSKAWEKLGEFQLPFDTAWALKFVQAASIDPDDVRLDVTQSRAETTFSFYGVRDWSHSELEQAIFGMPETGDRLSIRDIEHLAIGIRAIAQSKSTVFSLRYSDGSFAIWNGEEFVWQENLAPVDSALQIAVCHFDIGESKSIFSFDNLEARSFAARIAKGLTDYCHLCPIPLRIDGRSINGFINDPVLGRTNKSCPLAFLTSAPIEGEPPLRFPDEGFWSLTEDSISKSNDLKQAKIGPAALVSVHLSVRNSGSVDVHYTAGLGESHLIWLVDGVSYSRTKFEFKGVLGAGIIVNCSGLETDLSGLTARQSRVRDSRANAVLATIVSELAKLGGNIGKPDLSEHMKDCRPSGKRGLLVLLSNPLAGFMEMVQMGFSYLKSDQGQGLVDEQIDRGLERLTTLLASRVD